MKNNINRTIRSEEITIDVRICAALAANRGGEVYFAAIAPDMELTVITLDEAPDILLCFEEDDACGRHTYSLLQCHLVWYTELDNSESCRGNRNEK